MSAATVRAAVLQFPITMDIAVNMAALENLLTSLPVGTFAVAPEGVLSGYLPQPNFVDAIDRAATDAAIGRVADLCTGKRIHLVAGACIHEDNAWLNTSLYFGPKGQRHRYVKINLAQSERGTFTPGNALPVFDIEIEGSPVRLGIQMCREIRYAEQWRVLAAQGAQVFAYVNNAVGSKTGDALWRAHMLSRAGETQRFILGANNAASDQTCPSMIVAPSGAVLAEAPMGAQCVATANLTLSDVSDWVISQARDDVVHVGLKADV